MKTASTRCLTLATIVLAGYTPGANSQSPIDSDSYIEIGGIDQWITIHGDSEDNPVILIIHGGPGSALTPISGNLFGAWETSFTIANWDQPGAGRTYAVTGDSIASDLTIQRIVADGIRVAEEILARTGKSKLVLLGGSWGSVIGLQMASSRPDLFYCYVGHGQLINSQAASLETYTTLLSWAREAGESDALAQLENIGAPPWNSLRNFGIMARIAGPYEERITRPLPLLRELWSDKNFYEDRAKWFEGVEFSEEHFFGYALEGELMKVDLAGEVTDLEIPIFVIQGAEDIRTPAAHVQRYLEGLNAPLKELVLIERAGHEVLLQATDEFFRELAARVLPLAIQ